jgi:hypothetical protein
MVEYGAATEEEMVLAFLQAELRSPRFGQNYVAHLQQIGCDERIVTQADLANLRDNAIRSDLLTRVRGFSTRTFLFAGFPPDVAWQHCKLTAGEVSEVRYGKYKSWIGLSGGTRRVGDGARRSSACTAGERPNTDVIAVARAISLGTTYPALIAASDGHGALVLIEGHTRATAYAIANTAAHIIVGTAPEIANWKYW